MKKRFVSIVVACAVVALSAVILAGCSSASTQQSTEKTPAPAAESTDFVVGFDAAYPPYGFLADDGSYTGFDLELAQAVCEKNGWNYVANPIDWDAKDALIQSGNITCIWNGFTYEGREDNYAWSDRYMLNEQVIVVKADSGIASEADLAGKTVITQVDSAAYEVLTEGDKADLGKSFKQLTTISDYNNAFMQLESGVVDAVACDLSIANYQIAAKPDVYKNIVTLSSEHYAVGFAKDNTDMAKKVSETLAALDKDGTVKALCEKYASYGISYDNWVLGK